MNLKGAYGYMQTNMQYRKVPKTGEMISVLAFGCMRFPTTGGKINEEESKALLYKAIDLGVNYLDTAYPYHGGQSESFLGRVLKDGYREKVKIATKLPVWNVKSREDMDKILNKQLEKLQTETIDFYLLHMLMGTESWERAKSLGVIDFLEDANAAGKIKNIGFSYHGNAEEFKTIIDDYDWVFTQIQFNYLDTHSQAGTEGLKYAAAKDIAVMIMEPLRGGNLAIKVPKEVQKEWDVSDKEWSPALWSLRWIWNFEEVCTVLSGMNVDTFIDENVRGANEALANSFSKDDLDRVDRVKKIYETLMKVPCTACGYCMPCPAGVNIPLCFSYYNEKYLFRKKHTRYMYLGTQGGMIGDKKSVASLCYECGKCEKVCPQHIPIIKSLKNVKKEFEGILYPIMYWFAKTFLRRSKPHKKK
jgi:predicted aldo/keto reductase-like oxidoreductase